MFIHAVVCSGPSSINNGGKGLSVSSDSYGFLPSLLEGSTESTLAPAGQKHCIPTPGQRLLIAAVISAKVTAIPPEDEL